MQDAGHSDSGNRSTFYRGKQNPAKRIADGRSISTLKRLSNKLSIKIRKGLFFKSNLLRQLKAFFHKIHNTVSYAYIFVLSIINRKETLLFTMKLCSSGLKQIPSLHHSTIPSLV